MRTCSGSGKDLDVWIEELRVLDEQTGGKAATLALGGIGLGGEAGEVTDLVKKLIFHGKPYDEETRQKLIKELGDVFWYAGALCHVLDVSFEEVLDLNRAKLEARYPNGFSTADSLAKKDELLLPST